MSLSGVPCLVPESILRATEECWSKFPGGPLILPKVGKTSLTAIFNDGFGFNQDSKLSGDDWIGMCAKILLKGIPQCYEQH